MDQKQFSEIFTELRKKKGLTQAEVASNLNVSPQAVSKWEKGESCPDISLLGKIADLFDVSVDYLLGRGQQASKVEAIEPPHGDYSNYFLRLVAEDVGENGKANRAKINLPLSIVAMMFNSSSEIKLGNFTLNKAQVEQIFDMVEAGASGNILEAESEDGGICKIFIEKIK